MNHRIFGAYTTRPILLHAAVVVVRPCVRRITTVGQFMLNPPALTNKIPWQKPMYNRLATKLPIDHPVTPLTPPNPTNVAPRLLDSSCSATGDMLAQQEVSGNQNIDNPNPGCSLPYDPYSLSMDFSSTGRPWYWDELADFVISAAAPRPGTFPFVSLSFPDTPRALCRNLLRLLHSRRSFPTLPALLDYHDLFPQLQSTRSYNLLLSLSLRHASFGTAHSLLAGMRSKGIDANLETQKLEIRCFIQTGWWNQAWDYAQKHCSVPTIVGHLKLPLVIWLEFLRGAKRGCIRKRTHPKTAEHFVQLDRERFRLLMDNHPAREELADVAPRTILFIVRSMLQLGQRESALSLTREFLFNLPPNVSTTLARKHLDIIHLHLVFGSPERGLRRFYENRRILISLLKSHPALLPTSTTLFLLLGSLRYSKRCGTIAWDVFRSFKHQWATEEDRRTRRRLISFALKEGRMDIVEKLVCDLPSQSNHAFWKVEHLVMAGDEVPSYKKLLRPPDRAIFRKNGREEYLWHLLYRRIRRGKRGDMQSEESYPHAHHIIVSAGEKPY